MEGGEGVIVQRSKPGFRSALDTGFRNGKLGFQPCDAGVQFAWFVSNPYT